MLNSVWAETARIPAFPPLEGDTRTDVLIVGGGMAGLLCAYLLKQAGVDCLLVEAGRICGGISRNTTAKLTSQHGLCYDKLLKSLGAEKARLYWQANEAALAQYRQLGREIPCGLETRDAYVYTLDSPESSGGSWRPWSAWASRRTWSRTCPFRSGPPAPSGSGTRRSFTR